jgi:hypothetical protein
MASAAGRYTNSSMPSSSFASVATIVRRLMVAMIKSSLILGSRVEYRSAVLCAVDGVRLGS